MRFFTRAPFAHPTRASFAHPAHLTPSYGAAPLLDLEERHG